MELLKKNIILVIVITISVLGSAIMGYIVIQKNSQMYEAIERAKVLGERAVKLKGGKFSPVAENVELLKKDIAELLKIKNSIYKKFGNPKRNALLAFFKDLGTSEADFQKKWNANKLNKSYSGLKQFIGDEFSETQNNALAEFIKNIQKTTVENVDNGNVFYLLLEALGIDRKMENTFCSKYIKNQKEALLNLLNAEDIRLSDNVAQFTFAMYNKDNLPKGSDSPVIIQHFSYINDIVFRVIKAKLTEIKSLSRNNPTLNGVTDANGFMKLKYSITVQGELKNIKTFVNLLTKAADDNIVYIIRDIKLLRLIDSVAKLNTERTLRNNIDEVERKKILKSSYEKIKLDDILSRLPNYGVPIIGAENVLEATIEFEAYVFNGINK